MGKFVCKKPAQLECIIINIKHNKIIFFIVFRLAYQMINNLPKDKNVIQIIKKDV